MADNDSTDETVALVAQMNPRVVLLRTGGNLGYAKACNLAFDCL